MASGNHKIKKHRQNYGAPLFLHGYLCMVAFSKLLYDPAAAIMPVSEHVTAGITFGTVYPSAFKRCYNAIPARPFFHYQGTGNIIAEFQFFKPVKLIFV
jgi:hypothetical protein